MTSYTRTGDFRIFESNHAPLHSCKFLLSLPKLQHHDCPQYQENRISNLVYEQNNYCYISKSLEQSNRTNLNRIRVVINSQQVDLQRNGHKGWNNQPICVMTHELKHFECDFDIKDTISLWYNRKYNKLRR